MLSHRSQKVLEAAIEQAAQKNNEFVTLEHILFSLVQTCRGLGVNPREYLEDVMRKIMGHNSQKLYALLPDEWLKGRNQKSIS